MKMLALVLVMAAAGLAHAAPDKIIDNQSGLFTVSDGTNVYWTNYVGNRGGEVMMAPVNGGQAIVLAQATGPRRLRVHNGMVYWAETSSDTIKMVSTSGGPVQTLATGQNKPMGLFIYDGHVYWTNAGVGSPDGSVMRIALNGGSPEVLAKNLNMPMGLVVVKDVVYWSEVVSDYKVFSYSLKDKVTKEVADAYVPSMASDDNNVYWVDAAAGTVMALRVDSGKIEQLADKQVSPSSLHSDGMTLFWTTDGTGNNKGTVMKVSVSGGSVSTVAQNRKNPFGISGDADNIYWTEIDGAIYKFKK